MKAKAQKGNRFTEGDVIYRLNDTHGGVCDPVTRYYVERVLSDRTYKVRYFNRNGALTDQSFVLTEDQEAQYYFDPVATSLLAQVIHGVRTA